MERAIYDARNKRAAQVSKVSTDEQNGDDDATDKGTDVNAVQYTSLNATSASSEDTSPRTAGNGRLGKSSDLIPRGAPTSGTTAQN